MLTLSTTLALAAPPALTCETVAVTVPAEAMADERPKGFQWEGFRPMLTLVDGRVLLLRGSALEKLSRKSLKRQHTENGPDRVMQVVLVEPNGKLDTIVTIPRGTLLEGHRTPDGGVVMSRTSGSVAALDHIDAKGTWTGSTRLPDDPQFYTWWRSNNPLTGTATASLIATAPGRAIITHDGRTTAFDLVGNTVLGSAELHGLAIPPIHHKRKHELIIAERAMRLAWYTPALERIQAEDCNSCRVAALERTRRRNVEWTPTEETRRVVVVRPDVDAFEISTRGVSGGKGTEILRRIAFPEEVEGERFTWHLRSGPMGTALLAVSAPGAERPQQVWVVGPGADPVGASLTVPPGMVGDGEHLVADGIGGLIRLRAVRGADASETTRAVTFFDPRSGRHHDLIERDDVEPEVWAALSNRALRDRAPDGTILLRVEGEPDMQRLPPGESTATFERCRLTDP